MVIPAAPTSVGWYRYGAAPSDARGNTVSPATSPPGKTAPAHWPPCAGPSRACASP